LKTTRKNAKEGKKKKKQKLLMFLFRSHWRQPLHANSCEQFFEKYGRWITGLSRFDAEIQFLWITPERRKSREYLAEPQQQWPKHLERYIPLKDANEGIWEENENAQKKPLKDKAAKRRHRLTRRRV
jgi:hypothetical protein